MPIVRVVSLTLPQRALGENKLRIAPLRAVLCFWLDQDLQDLKWEINMNNVDHNIQVTQWYQTVIEAQELALKMPEMGVALNDLSSMPFYRLIGVLAFLRRMSAESKA